MSNDTCPDCGSTLYRDGHCTMCAIRRSHEQHRQMKERSGPEYDLAVSRSRTGTAAWRAAGSPARVTMVTVGSRDANGIYQGVRRWYLAAPFKRGARIEATPEQVDAWYAWRSAVRDQPGDPEAAPREADRYLLPVRQTRLESLYGSQSP